MSEWGGGIKNVEHKSFWNVDFLSSPQENGKGLKVHDFYINVLNFGNNFERLCIWIGHSMLECRICGMQKAQTNWFWQFLSAITNGQAGSFIGTYSNRHGIAEVFSFGKRLNFEYLE